MTHAEFFYRDNTENMVQAFRAALYKRGKPERLYFDNGSSYSLREIAQACLRLDIHLSHAPIRDSAAKGKTPLLPKLHQRPPSSLEPIYLRNNPASNPRKS